MTYRLVSAGIATLVITAATITQIALQSSPDADTASGTPGKTVGGKTGCGGDPAYQNYKPGTLAKITEAIRKSSGYKNPVEGSLTVVDTAGFAQTSGFASADTDSMITALLGEPTKATPVEPEPDTISFRGSRDRGTTGATIRRYIANLKELYRIRRTANPRVEGELVAVFAIDSYGTVIHLKFRSSSLNDTLFERRVYNEIKSWQFDTIPHTGTTEVVYPFYFGR